jgi:GNAT superfamily N-acetyltransferase
MIADYELAVREHQFDLVDDADGLAGLVETSLREDHLWIENIAVRPDCQGRGLGRRLLARAEQRATSAGLGELRLLTNGAFAANVALYERVGYVITHREPFMGGTTVHMSKRLGLQERG